MAQKHFSSWFLFENGWCGRWHLRKIARRSPPTAFGIAFRLRQALQVERKLH
ncbi:MAG: hypothetical protein GX443_09885 [Deltaproteobacteria bacterium]|nr:hypothetical protein [Deltaproteobacteria bacterium]